MIYLIRASHANDFELQNYKGIKDLQVVTSQHPLTKISLPQIKLWSPTDLPVFPFRRQILNRLIGGEQWLLGLEKLVEKKSNDSNHRTIFHIVLQMIRRGHSHLARRCRYSGCPGARLRNQDYPGSTNSSLHQREGDLLAFARNHAGVWRL